MGRLLEKGLGFVALSAGKREGTGRLERGSLN